MMNAHVHCDDARLERNEQSALSPDDLPANMEHPDRAALAEHIDPHVPRANPAGRALCT